MRGGYKQLINADTYQVYSRAERCIFILVLLIFSCFLLLVAKHSWDFHRRLWGERLFGFKNWILLDCIVGMFCRRWNLPCFSMCLTLFNFGINFAKVGFSKVFILHSLMEMLLCPVIINDKGFVLISFLRLTIFGNTCDFFLVCISIKRRFRPQDSTDIGLIDGKTRWPFSLESLKSLERESSRCAWASSAFQTFFEGPM